MTTPIEREALIAWNREMQEVFRDSDGTAYLNHREAAEMLAADAQEIALLNAQITDWTAAYQAAYQEGTQATVKRFQLQAELDGIRKQEPVANVTVSKWRGLGNVEWQEQVELPDGTHMLYLTAGAQQVAVPQKFTKCGIAPLCACFDKQGGLNCATVLSC